MQTDLIEFGVGVEGYYSSEVSSVDMLLNVLRLPLAKLTVDLVVGVSDVVLHALQELLADELVLQNSKPALLPDEVPLALLRRLVSVVGLPLECDSVAPNRNVLELHAEVRLFVDGVAHLVHLFHDEDDFAELVQLFKEDLVLSELLRL